MGGMSRTGRGRGRARAGIAVVRVHTNAAAMAAQGVGFVAPLAAARVPAGVLAALPPGAGTAVDYAAGRDAGKTPAARGSYRSLEDASMDRPPPPETHPPAR